MSFVNADILIFASNEIELLYDTIEIICRECSCTDIHRISVIFKDLTNAKGIQKVILCRNKYPDYNINYQAQSGTGLYDSVYYAFAESRSSHTICISADLEMDPHVVSKFIEYSKENPHHIITASRWIDGSHVDKYNPVRKMGVNILRIFYNILFNSRLTDLTLPFQIFPMEYFKRINFGIPQDFLWECTFIPIRVGIPFIEIPARWVCRTEAKSNFNGLDCVKRAICITRVALKARYKPIEKIYK